MDSAPIRDIFADDMQAEVPVKVYFKTSWHQLYLLLPLAFLFIVTLSVAVTLNVDVTLRVDVSPVSR